MQSLRFRHTAATLALTLCVVLSLCFSPEAIAKRIKCWTNDEGVRECGNVVPPKYSQQGHKEFSKRGFTVSSQKRAKTKEELEAERKTKQEATERERRNAQLAREQAAKDRVLLDTFTTEEDLILAHQGRVAAIDSRINHTRQIVEGLKRGLSELRAQAAGEERSGKAIPESLHNKILSAKRRISENLTFISERHSAKADLDGQFQADLERYRRLKRTN
jgi:hypothetical protein